MKRFIIQLVGVAILTWGIMFTIHTAYGADSNSYTVQDHYVTKCTKDTSDIIERGIAGALLGSIFGNENTGKAAAALGALTAQEECKEVYSHSTITFTYNGWTYSIPFEKNQ